MSGIPLIISVDDHVVEPPGVWQDRLPSRYKDAGPRLVRTYGRPERARHGYYVVDDPDSPAAVWVDQWQYEDMRKVIPVGEAQVGPLRDRHYQALATYDEMAP